MPFLECFSRRASFDWFVAAVFGLIVRIDQKGVSSLVRWLKLEPKHYDNLLHLFRSSSWHPAEMLKQWLSVVNNATSVVKINGSRLMVGDCIKVSKEGRRMPGSKKLHQDSENSGKATYIFGP
jgi:hypothetical protein